MRIWDISPGYLNRQSLLGEHRELHGIVSIIVNNKKGYSNHPETLRWVGNGWALRMRHSLLAAEMALRGYTDKTPVSTTSNRGVWPTIYVDEPSCQFEILKEKYKNKESGRIPLPATVQELWAHHHYSVLARDQDLYHKLGREVSKMQPGDEISDLAHTLTDLLRKPPLHAGIQNALQHMWGDLSNSRSVSKGEIESWPAARLLGEIQNRTLEIQEPYLMTSTALSELRVWISES